MTVESGNSCRVAGIFFFNFFFSECHFFQNLLSDCQTVIRGPWKTSETHLSTECVRTQNAGRAGHGSSRFPSPNTFILFVLYCVLQQIKHILCRRPDLYPSLKNGKQTPTGLAPPAHETHLSTKRFRQRCGKTLAYYARGLPVFLGSEANKYSGL